jgi:uncharacterized iron-regulated protein
MIATNRLGVAVFAVPSSNHNIVNLIDSPNDRILVIFGSGHGTREIGENQKCRELNQGKSE